MWLLPLEFLSEKTGDILNPNSAIKVLKNRIVLIMRVNPDVRIVSMVSVNH
jgi:hypothetical protein